MSPGARIASFALVLGAAFVAAFALGSAFEPADVDAGGGHGDEAAHTKASTHGEAGGHDEAGYALRLAPTGLTRGEGGELRFAIIGPDGEAVTEFERLHERRMHLIVVRREGDLEYLHVHPEEGGHEHGGDPAAAHPSEIAFATSFPTAGRYRLYLQFRHEGAVRTAEFTVEVPR